MTTAHRPTFDPARGKEAQRGPAFHQRLLPAHTQLKHRQPGQGGDAEATKRDFRAELLEAEAHHFTTKNNGGDANQDAIAGSSSALKRPLQVEPAADEGEEAEAAQKRRRIEMATELEELDVDGDGDSSDDSSDEEYGI